MTNKHIIDRRLDERSYLTFNYLNNGEVARIVTLPFFEDINVQEGKKARFQDYSLLSRSSNLYSYLGADSRRFDLTFSMTLPHIVDSIRKYGPSSYIEDQGSLENLKDLFKNPTDFQSELGTVGELTAQYLASQDIKSDVNYIANTEWGQKGITPKEKEDLIERYDAGATISDILEAQKGLNSSTSDQAFSLKEQGAEEYTKIVSANFDYKQVMETVVFWTNIIRTCVTNNANDITNGPPMIRLNHGILYQDVPCICKEVNISFDRMAGYDIDTLLPRKIDVSMDLEEFRMGDLGEYAYGQETKRDNIAGWEAVFKKGTIDPGRV